MTVGCVRSQEAKEEVRHGGDGSENSDVDKHVCVCVRGETLKGVSDQKAQFYKRKVLIYIKIYAE